MAALAKGASLPPAHFQPDFKQLAVRRSLRSLFPQKLVPPKRVKTAESGGKPSRCDAFGRGDCKRAKQHQHQLPGSETALCMHTALRASQAGVGEAAFSLSLQ